MRFVSLCCLLFAGSLFAQQPIALSTSDPKFTPRWETIPGPTLALGNAGRSVGWNEGVRPPSSYEIAYALVDEDFKISPYSAPVTINPTCHDWDVVGTTPGVPLWTRAAGIYWVRRTAGQTAWQTFAVDVNRQHQWLAAKPFKSICGWSHTYGGHWLYQAGNYSSFTPTASTTLTVAPPAPSVRLLECPNRAYVVGFSWCCNQNETPMSPTITVPAVAGNPANQHTPFTLVRNLPAGRQQPPQGALGMYLYIQDNGQWHRQPSPDGHTGHLWPLDMVTLKVNQFVASGIAPGNTNGRSYLSSLHLALRDWARDIIIDTDQTICSPLISEFSGPTWSYQPQNHWIAVYGTTNGTGTWTLTIDGITSGAMPRTSNAGGAWAQWQPVLDAAFGAGNVTISDFWPLYAPKIECTGKWAGQSMSGKISVQVKDAAGVVVDPAIVNTVVGRGWVMSQADSKFGRTIATSNAGAFVVQDTATTPDSEATTGYPTGWALWLECSQNTRLTGCKFVMTKSTCGIATCDNSGGGCFHFQPTNCSVGIHFTNTSPNTFGLRCLGTSSYYEGNHLCSELIATNCSFQAKFPIICEGNQAANWQFRDTNFYSTGTFDSAIITAANAGNITCRGRTTADNARCLLASPWCKSLYMESIWIDQGMPTLISSDANSWTSMTIYGGKINQIINSREEALAALAMQGYDPNNAQMQSLDGVSLESLLAYMHCFESTAGPVESYKAKLIIDQLDSQHNVAIPAKAITPKANFQFKPRAVDEVPSLLSTLPIGP